MLHLSEETPAGWAERAAAAMDQILVDHAHCEKKAAGTAVSLLFRYPERTVLLEPLSRLAREELSHFELVLRALKERNLNFERQKPSPYAARLLEVVNKSEPERLLDTLLCLAVIEARSCERMKLLAAALSDDGLKRLYEGLLASEARHHGTYVELAKSCFPKRDVMPRLKEIADHEAAILRDAPQEPRLHNG